MAAVVHFIGWKSFERELRLATEATREIRNAANFQADDGRLDRGRGAAGE